MSSFFILELDTTAPNLTITSPTYTLYDIDTEFYIQSSEKLFNGYQEIFTTDSLGNRDDYIFNFISDTHCYGVINFKGYEDRIFTLHVRLQDEVGNSSEEITRSINVRVSKKIDMRIFEDKIKVELMEESKDCIVIGEIKPVKISKQNYGIEIEGKIRRVKLEI